MKLTWLGHACFKVEEKGFVLIFDPYEDGSVPGLLPIREKANLVLCSHGHGDHCGRENVEIVEGAENPFSMETIDTYHDDVRGAKRGTNRIVVIDNGKQRIAHLGDLGCELEPDQLEKLRGLDAVMIPVGGHFTIDAKQAADLVARIQPGIVIPMHFRDDEAGFGYEVIGTVDAFTEQFEKVVRSTESELDFDDLPSAQVVVLRPKQAMGVS